MATVLTGPFFFLQHRQSNWELKMATVEQVYGKAAAMRLRTEKSVLEQFTVSRSLSL